MAIEQAPIETVEYLVVVICPGSHKVLVLDTGNAYGLPTVRIARWRRPAEQVRQAIEITFGLHIFVIDFLSGEDGSSHCALAQLIAPYQGSLLRWVPYEMIAGALSSNQQRVTLDLLSRGASERSISQIGWIEQAILWVESVTNSKLVSKSNIEQFNAGAGFSLVRFRMDNGREYWLKATGKPNQHELHVTKLLSELNPDLLPEFTSYRPEWNAWLTLGGLDPLKHFPDDPHAAFKFLKGAVESMASLQLNMRNRGQDLLTAGAFDQRMSTLSEHSTELFDYLDEAMRLQVSTKVPRLEPDRLNEMSAILRDVCRRTEDLGLRFFRFRQSPASR